MAWGVLLHGIYWKHQVFGRLFLKTCVLFKPYQARTRIFKGKGQLSSASGLASASGAMHSLPIGPQTGLV